MVAPIGRAFALGRQGRIETGHFPAGAAERAAQAQRDAEAADGVDEQADLDAFLGTCGQQAHDFATDGIVAEDVGREADAALRSLDLPTQFLEGFASMAVAQQAEAVAAEIRLLAESPGHPIHFLLRLGEGGVLAAAEQEEEQGGG